MGSECREGAGSAPAVAAPGPASGATAPAREEAAALEAALERLRESESRLRATQAALPDLMFCHARDGRIRTVHVPAGSEGLLAPGTRPGAHIRDVLPADVARRWMEAAARVLAGEEPATCEYELELPVGRRHFEARMVRRVPDEVLSLVRDITAPVRDREARERASELFEAAWDQSPAVIVVAEPPEGRVRFVNGAGLAAAGLPAAEVIGAPLDTLLNALPLRDARGDPLPAEEVPTVAALRGEVVRARTVRAVLADGKEHWGIVNAAPVRDRDGAVVAAVSVTQDITEQKRLERELFEVAQQERERMARDLHDSLGQQLTGAALMAKALELKLRADGTNGAAEAREISEMVTAAHQQARFVAKGLFSIPVEAGMEAALGDLADNAAGLYGVRVEVRVRETEPITDPEVASHLYQICREAVTNAVRHGRAGRIRLDLEASPEAIRLRVRDDGRGLAPPAERSTGVGVRSMRFRAEQLGGTLELSSDPDGTTVRVEAPRPGPAGR